MRETWELPRVAARLVGALGGAPGVADTIADVVPVPTSFIAIILKEVG